MTATRVAVGACVLLSVLALVAVPGPASAGDQVVGSPDLSVYSPDNELAPGEETTLPVFLTNEGDLRQGGPAEYVDRVTTARGTTLTVRDDGAPIEVTTGRYPVGLVPAGTTGPVPISVTVPDDARPGTYEIPVRVRYSYTVLVDYSTGSPEYFDGTRTRTYDLTVRIRDRPRFEVVETTSTTRVNGRGTTAITLRNVGTERARDATLRVASASDEVRLGTRSRSSRAFAAAWEPGATRTFEFTTSVTDDAVTREYPLTAVVTYEDRDGIRRTTENLTATLVPGPEQTFALSNVSSSLHVGEPGVVRGTVTNTGPIPVDSASLVFGPATPTLRPDDREAGLGSLAVGEQRDFRFELAVSENATPGDRQLNFTVRYRDQRDDRQTSASLEPTVTVAPERDWLAVTPADATFRIDTDNRLTVRIRNAERVALRDLRAGLTTQPPFTTESRVAYVDRLRPDESATLAFEVTVAEEAVPTRSAVTLNVTAERPDGEELVLDQYVVPVTVEAERGASDATILAAGALVALALLVAGWWWLRR